MQHERQLGTAEQEGGQRALLGEAYVFPSAPHAARPGRGTRQQTGRHVAARQLRIVERALERLDGARRKQRGPNRRRIEARQLEQAACEGIVSPACTIQACKTRLELCNTTLHPAVERGDAIARALQTIDRLPTVLQRGEVGGARMPQPLERGARRIEGRAKAQRIDRRLPGAAARVGPRAQRRGGGNGGKPPRIERVDADLAGGELQHRDLELAGPLARFGEHAPRDPIARLRGDSTVGCARRAEAQPFGDDAVDDEFLLRDRKSTRLNSSHGYISYAVFCLKKKTNKKSTNLIAQKIRKTISVN